MRIVFVGSQRYGSISWAIYTALCALGHQVYPVDVSQYITSKIPLVARIKQKLFRKPWRVTVEQINQHVLKSVEEKQADLTFYVNLFAIRPATLEASRKSGPNVALFLDDMFNPSNVFFDINACVPNLDGIFTTKSFNVQEFLAIGANNVIFINNGFSPECHHLPHVDLTDQPYRADVTLVGTFRPDRADLLGKLMAACGDSVHFAIYGDGWEKMKRWWYWRSLSRFNRWSKVMRAVQFRSVWCEDMAQVFSQSKICLGLLHHGNRDVQTSRSIEIPACGGFMLAEYSTEHAALFVENQEAVYYHSFDDLVTKIRYYMDHDTERKAIAESGYLRTRRDDYSYKRIIGDGLQTFLHQLPVEYNTLGDKGKIQSP